MVGFDRSRPALTSSTLTHALIVLLSSGYSCGLLAATTEEEDYFAYTIEELMQIKVTAQKREQNAQDVPLSVATLSGDALEVLNSSGMDLRQLSLRVPSLLIESSFGRTFPRFYLRGMGNTDFDLIASQPVSLILDEVVLENALLKGYPLFDLDRVEVLRGPQGSLFGRNTTTGIVKFESRKPDKQLRSYASLGYGDFGSINFEAAVNTPLNSSYTARVSVLSQTRNGWINNMAPGYEQHDQLGGYDDKAGRFQLRYQPDDNLDLLINYHLRDAEANARVFMANIIEPGSNDFVDGFDYNTVYQDAGARNDQAIALRGLNLRMEYNLGHHSLFYVGGYERAEIFSRGDIDGGYGACFLAIVPAGQNPCDRSRYGPYDRQAEVGPGFIPQPSETGVAMPEHRQLTHEIRVASNELGRLDYQFGGFKFDEDLTINNLSYDSLSGGALSGLSVQNMETRSEALFGSLDFDWTDKLSIVAGARFSTDQRDWQGNLRLSPFGAPPLLAEADVGDSQWSWDISGMYQRDETLNLYARIAKGYRAPSIQGRNLLFSAPATTAESETLISYETGFKSELMRHNARINGSVYYYRANGQQLTAVGGGNNTARLLNADQTLGYGFELETEFALTPTFLLNAGISYNHTELDDPDLAVALCGSACTVLNPTIADPGNPSRRLALIDGNSLPQSPKWIANLSARYGWALGRGELYLYTDWAYRSAVHFFLYDAEEYSDAYLLEGGIRLGYRWSRTRSKFEVALLGRNITDDTSLESGLDFNNRTGFLNEPRYWGLELKAKFF